MGSLEGGPEGAVFLVGRLAYHPSLCAAGQNKEWRVRTRGRQGVGQGGRAKHCKVNTLAKLKLPRALLCLGLSHFKIVTPHFTTNLSNVEILIKK